MYYNTISFIQTIIRWALSGRETQARRCPRRREAQAGDRGAGEGGRGGGGAHQEGTYVPSPAAGHSLLHAHDRDLRRRLRRK